jgi:hypothetical protein
MKMNVTMFWDMIDRARAQTNGVVVTYNPLFGWVGMKEPLIKELSMLGVADIFTWNDILIFYRGLLNKTKLWAAAHVINGKCSDDKFDYFRNWLISQGKDVVLMALRDPESLTNLETCVRGVGYEELSYIPQRAYNLKFGTSGPDQYSDEYMKFRSIRESMKAEITSEVVYADDIDVDLSKGDNLLTLLPTLCKKFNWTGRSKVYIVGKGIHDGILNMSIQLPDNGKDLKDYSYDEIMKILIDGMRFEMKSFRDWYSSALTRPVR